MDIANRQSARERTIDQAVSRRTQQLMRCNDELDAFARQVAHEIRTPIGQIATIAQLLLERSDGERDLHSWLQMQLAATRQMDDTVQGLLSLARSSLASLHVQEIDLSALCDALRIELAPSQPRRAPVEWRIQAGMRMRGCLEQVTVLMRNLLSNAVKYTRDVERPWVSVSAVLDGVVTVQDNGAGFDSARAARLFQPFGRLHDGREFEGIGLGLSIVKRIVDRHDGWIRASARDGGGASFEFSLTQSAQRP